MNKIVAKTLLLIAVVLTFSQLGCETHSKPTTTPSPTPVLSQYQLGYRLLAAYPDFFWCDPDFYPVSHEGQEQSNAIAQFPAIKENTFELTAILAHLNLPYEAEYTDEEKLSIYREHKKLTYVVQMTDSGNTYSFTLRTEEGQGYSITGTVTLTGVIKETKKDTGFNTCPICLTKGTLIATPDGPIPVEQIRTRMTVWTSNESDSRVATEVIRIISTPVPPSFHVIRITLSDGRTVAASPGHPTADWLPLGDYHAGDTIDGATVVSVEQVPYDGGATYDILPSGPSGQYWANGILLKSTLAGR